MTFTVRIRGSGPLLSEYQCSTCGRIELTVTRDPAGNPPEWAQCPCGLDAYWVISAGSLAFPRFSVEKGKPSEAPFPHATSTRELADGMSMSEWKQKRRAVWAEKSRREIKAKI